MSPYEVNKIARHFSRSAEVFSCIQKSVEKAGCCVVGGTEGNQKKYAMIEMLTARLQCSVINTVRHTRNKACYRPQEYIKRFDAWTADPRLVRNKDESSVWWSFTLFSVGITSTQQKKRNVCFTQTAEAYVGLYIVCVIGHNVYVLLSKS